MKFVKERVNVICQELARLSISQKIKITDMQVKNGCYITPAEADASEEPWTSFDTVNDRWYGPDKHYWFRTTITVPESFDGKNLWMRVHAGLDDWDDGRNPQFLLFANGEVIQGMDINHREVLVRENAKAGEKIQLDLQSYTGTLHSEFRLLADLEEHDAKIEEIYYDLIVPMQGLNRMDEDNKTRLDLETALTNTINLLDLRKPYSKEFYASIEEAEKYFKKEPFEEMGYAKLDTHREIRSGFPEVIFCARKADEHLLKIFTRLYEQDGEVFGTRASEHQYELIREKFPEVVYDPLSHILKIEKKDKKRIGKIAVCTAEAAQTAEYFGANVERIYDVGVSGIHRLLSRLDTIQSANCVVAVAGMEGALASVLGGLVDKPVIAVPTSVGYGASMNGLSALLTMINSCANGIAVVNIDNGYGAGYIATQINRMGVHKDE